MNDRLYRSRNERMFAGVAGGIAERYDFDPSLVRVTWVILMLLTGGLFFLVYIVMAIVIPEAPAAADPWSAWSTPQPAPGAAPGWSGPDPVTTTAAFAAAGTTAGDTGSGTAAGAPDGGPGTATAGATAPVDPAGTVPPGGSTMPPSAPPPWAVPPRSGRHRRDRGASGAVIGGIILVLIGAYFLVRQFVPQLDTGTLWPLILVVIGIALVVGSVRRGSGDDHRA